ncbi:PREDICTED: radial spoke head 10 homolog B-like [Eufriesea mexicana]|uniref:radial spoke head 10 homolog B-like n=1 Tax=Eufriesea mexicana TaxID=516756 RepID=UPI00083C2B71|nr:PREDICTED: radial spoke head 10 homolog B-like [Eufriesea mexicana]
MEEEGSEMSEDLPFEDILADKRRTYSAKEEFIYLLYNDILMYFVKEWDGKYLRKKPKKRIDDDTKVSSNDDEDIDEEKSNEIANDLKGSENNSDKYDNGTTKSSSVSSWKLTLPDEFANIRFISNNTYSGRISRKMMEGEGVYRWSNGAQYKGEFQQNRMHGKGLLEWNNVCWYEGEFINGYQHGRGIMVDGENRYMYTGQWYMGQRLGKGYSRYRDNGSYDGDWVMDKMEGVGLRIYPSGARYVGEWKNGIRDGKGTMVWTNGNVYRGEWKCGAMHGYGEYVWNGFFNKTFTWPQEASYAGYWRHGMRHGKGEMKLNSVGGAKYSGYWKDNKKHGYGVIIGSNGETFESDPLFLNDILCAPNVETDNSENETEMKSEKECVRVAKEAEPIFLEKPDELAEASITPILRPEQFPNLSYYITRLLDPKSLEPHRIRLQLRITLRSQRPLKPTPNPIWRSLAGNTKNSGHTIV